MSLAVACNTGFAGILTVDPRKSTPVSIAPHALRQRAQRASVETGNHPGQSMPTPMLPSTTLNAEGLPSTGSRATGELADQNRGPAPQVPWNLVLVVVAAGVIVYSANLNP